MKKIILSAIIVLLAFTNVSRIYADDFSEAIIKAKKKLTDATNSDDTKALIKVRGDFERILQLKKNQWLVNYYMAYTDLMLEYISMQGKDNTVTKKYNESALDLLNKSTDMKDDFETYNRVYAEYFADNQPCRTTVEVGALPTPIAIELKVIAIIDKGEQ